MGAVLIVEDDRDTSEFLVELVERIGYTATVLANGKHVVEWVRKHRPELILLDLMLPDVDGFTVCEQLKLERSTNLIPIIMVTGLDDYPDRVHGLKVGANRYISKPFTAEQLIRTIQEVMAWRTELLTKGTQGEIHFHLQSDLGYLEQLNQLLASMLHFSGLSELEVKQLIMVVRELGTNAIEWGHRRQRERIVTVTYRIDTQKITVVIKDTGPGFNPQKVPHAARVDDPVSHLEVREKLGLREGGFGILISSGLVDDLQYNEAGNEVRFVKYFPPREGSTISAPA